MLAGVDVNPVVLFRRIGLHRGGIRGERLALAIIQRKGEGVAAGFVHIERQGEVHQRHFIDFGVAEQVAARRHIDVIPPPGAVQVIPQLRLGMGGLGDRDLEPRAGVDRDAHDAAERDRGIAVGAHRHAAGEVGVHEIMCFGIGNPVGVEREGTVDGSVEVKGGSVIGVPAVEGVAAVDRRGGRSDGIALLDSDRVHSGAAHGVKSDLVGLHRRCHRHGLVVVCQRNRLVTRIDLIVQGTLAQLHCFKARSGDQDVIVIAHRQIPRCGNIYALRRIIFQCNALLVNKLMMQDDSGVGKGLPILRHRHSQRVAGIELAGDGTGNCITYNRRVCGGELDELIGDRNFLDRKGLGVYAVCFLDIAAGEPRGIISGNLHLSIFRRIRRQRGGDSDRVAEGIGSLGSGVGFDLNGSISQSSRGQDAQQQNQDQQQTADPKCSTFHVSFLLKIPWWPPGGVPGGIVAGTYAGYLSGTPPPAESVSFLHHTIPMHQRQSVFGGIKQSLRVFQRISLQILQKRNKFRLSMDFSHLASIIIRRSCIQNASKLHPAIECSKQAQKAHAQAPP